MGSNYYETKTNNHMKMLKFTSVIFLLFLWTTNGVAQNYDSVVYDSATILVTKNDKTNQFQITNKLTKEKLQNLKFVKRIGEDFQVLDEYKKIYYLNENWKISDEMSNSYGLCGTVPHYTMTVEENKDSLFVYENETFYDFSDEIPAQKIFKISKKEADSIVFINGYNKFNFTENFNAFGYALSNPRAFFLVKDGKYFQAHNPQEVFDSLDFSSYGSYIKTIKDGKCGILEVIAPKYKEISNFNGYLAQAILADGRVVYIDKVGKEYY